MRRLARFAIVSLLCALPVCAQNDSIPPLRIAAGSVVPFRLQSRLRPSSTDAVDVLPEGTVLQVKLPQGIDSAVDGDGASFRGVLVSPLAEGDHVVVAANAQVHGLLALLRSQRHPEGFRYELLVTSLVDGGKAYVVTASLDSSLFEPRAVSSSLDAPSAAAAHN